MIGSTRLDFDLKTFCHCLWFTISRNLEVGETDTRVASAKVQHVAGVSENAVKRFLKKCSTVARF